MLEVNHLQAGYDCLQALWDVSLQVSQGEFVALIGPNGAGKTTTLRAISGLIKPLSGEIKFMGKDIHRMPADEIHRLGLSLITEDLNLFEGMTIRDNLLLGAYNQPDQKKIKASIEYVLELFPVFATRQKQLAGTLSGGERRMLAIGRGLMAEPKLLMVDEPSLGVAPMTVTLVFEALQALHRRGITILLVEQNVNTTLHIANKAYLLEKGEIALKGNSAELLENSYLRDTYLGAR